MFFDTGLGMYPTVFYKPGSTFLSLSHESVDRCFFSLKMGSLTIRVKSAV